MHGRAEGRAYRFELPTSAGGISQSTKGHAAEANAAVIEALARAGLERGFWLGRVHPDRFWEANRSWLMQPPRTVVGAVAVFAKRGLLRLAPLSEADAFDPAFYRFLIRDDRATPVDLYRHWLNIGCERDEAPNERQFLERAVGVSTVPERFDERAYRAALGPSDHPPRGRAMALAHLAAVGVPRGVTAGIHATDAAWLLEAIGRHHAFAGRFETALIALDLARAAGAPSLPGLLARGDALLALGRTPEAVRAYARAAESADAGVQSQISAVSALSGLADQESVPKPLGTSGPSRNRSSERQAAAPGIAALSCAEHAAGPPPAEGGDQASSSTLEAVLRRALDTLPIIGSRPSTPPGGERVVALLVEPGGNRDRAVALRRRELAQAGWSAEVLDATDAEAARAVTPAQAVFVTAAASPAIVHALLAARVLGLPILFDPAPRDIALLSNQQADQPARAARLRFVAALCDLALGSTEADARALGPLTRSGAGRAVLRGIDPARTNFLDQPRSEPLPDAVTVFCRIAPEWRAAFDDGAGPALTRALARHASLRVRVEGDAPGAALSPFADRVQVLPGPVGGDEAWRLLAGADLAIDVSVESGEATGTPWLDAATCGVPSLVAGVVARRWRLGIAEGVLAAESPASWDEALDRLLTDPDLRRELGAKARAAVLSSYHPVRAAATLAALLGEVTARPSMKVAVPGRESEIGAGHGRGGAARLELGVAGATATAGMAPGGPCDTAGHLETDDPLSELNRANAVRDAGRHAEAERAYEAILVVDPRYRFAHYELAFSHLLRRDHVGALAAINRLIAFAPADERARRLGALLLHRLGSHRSARALLEDLDDAETAALHEFGDFLERFPFEQALARCEALERGPNHIGAARLLELARDALHRGAGFAMIRLGDGEGAFLANDPEDRVRFARLHAANRADRARMWFGDGADIEATGFLAQACRIGEIVPRVDVVGIPYSGRIHLEYGHISPAGVTAMVDILRAVARDLGPHGHLCTHDIHFELHAEGLLDLIAEQERIGIVACHAELPALLARRFGVAVDLHKIPGEQLMAAEIGAEATAGEHFPTVFEEVMRALAQPLDGRLFLVSGGLLGKFYCDRIRSSGGVALDIGSLVDLWLGYRTRPGSNLDRMRL